MKKSDIQSPPGYFDRYINLMDNIELGEGFAQSIQEIEHFDLEKLRRHGDRTYAPGKWTVKQILQHLTDWERILGYRALIFARSAADGKLAGHDQDAMAQNANLENRSLDSVLAELKFVRHATIAMFEGFDDSALTNTGVSWKYELSVLALGFTILGHQRHHFRIIEEQYLPLAT